MKQTLTNWNVPELEVKFIRPPKKTVQIQEMTDAVSIFRSMWNDDVLDMQEHVCALFLDDSDHVIGFKCLHCGTLNACLVDVKILIALAVKSFASSIIIAHNHPSGSLKISDSDVLISYKIAAACNLMEIEFKDHLVMTRESYISIMEMLNAA